MSSTAFYNPHGLPHEPPNITTARDLSVLGRAIQDRFPRYFAYFQTQSFQYGKRTIRGHNRLLGKVNRVDGRRCEVDVGGAVIQATAVNIAGPGSGTTLSLRPERVALGEPVDGYPNSSPGRIEELIYLGDHIRTRVSLLGHDDFVVKVPNRGKHAVLRPGDAVTVAWLAEDCRALDLQRA